jgi:RimJ/RimL family protein N-acetyltransferase
VLRGEKVLLRALEQEDLPRLWVFHNNVEYELFAGGDPWEPESLARLQARFEAESREGDHDGMRFAIETDGKLIGSCGLFHIDQTSRTCELGIGIGDKDYWGRGYGRDTLRVLLDYAFRLRNFHKVWLRVVGVNERAIRAYRACGFVEEAHLRQQHWGDGQYVDEVYMGVLRSEWDQAKQGKGVNGG